MITTKLKLRLLYRYVIRRFRDKQYAYNYHLIFAVMWCGAMWSGIIKTINRWTDTAVLWQVVII